MSFDTIRPQINRGDIFYIADDPCQPPIGNEQWADRAGVITSNDALCHTSRTLTVVWLSTSNRKRLSPTHIPVISGNKKAIALCENPTTIDITRLRNKFGTCTSEEMHNIDQGICFGQGINTGCNPQGIFKKWENYAFKYLLHIDDTKPEQNPIFKNTPKLSYQYPYAIEIINKKEADHRIQHFCTECPNYCNCQGIPITCEKVLMDILKHYPDTLQQVQSQSIN